MKSRQFIYLVMAIILAASPLSAANTRAQFDAQIGAAMDRLNREAADPDGGIVLMELVRRDFGATSDDLKWALSQNFSWGEIVSFAYIRATTGQSFAELGGADARKDFWEFSEKSGMSADKMAKALDGFLKRVEKERNSRIFDRLRSSRRVLRMPDLGSGFGLFQEALDFRRLESARPTKSHTIGPSELAKGEK